MNSIKLIEELNELAKLIKIFENPENFQELDDSTMLAYPIRKEQLSSEWFISKVKSLASRLIQDFEIVFTDTDVSDLNQPLDRLLNWLAVSLLEEVEGNLKEENEELAAWSLYAICYKIGVELN